MFVRIGDLLPQFRVYEKLFPSPERLVQALSLAYVDIITFCAHAKAIFRYGQRNSGMLSFTHLPCRETYQGLVTNLRIGFKLTWKPFKRQFGQQLDAFRAHGKNIDKEAGVSNMLEAADSRAVVLANQAQLQKIDKGNSIQYYRSTTVRFT